MNTNRKTNKNLKRIAIAAGTTAAALFLSAGLVACGGNSTDTVAAPAQAVELTDDVVSIVADSAPVVDETPAVEAEVAAVVETSTKSVAKPAAKSTKTSKQKSSATGDAVILNVPTINDGAPTIDSNATPTGQDPTVPQADNTIINTPADQPAVEQPASNEQLASNEQPASTEQAPASNENTTTVSFPKISTTPSLASQLSGSNLADLTAPKISVPCLPGFNC